MQPDIELLQQYIKNGSEEAFAELVRRYVNLVYSSALRQVGGDAHLARDVAQNVFTDLAKKAHSLSRRESITGWLYTSAYFAAGKIIRTETRRREREEQFMRDPVNNATPDADWEKLRPTLDAVMHELNDTDREAVLLRYFENRAYTEVGAKLGVNENTARMRVDRAVEKLRTLLAKRGISTGAALASVISANAVQTAPATLSQTLATTSLATAGTFSLFKIINATNFKLAAGTLLVAGGIVAFTTNHHAHDASQIQTDTTPQQIAQLNTATEDQPIPSTDNSELATNHPIQPLKPGDESSRSNTENTAATSIAQPATNSSPAVNKGIDLKVKIVWLSQDGLQALRPAWPSPNNGSGTLTADQFKFVNQALQSAGNISTTESEIVANNGQSTVMSSKAPVPVDGTNVSIDALFGATPYFSPDSSAFQLNLFLKLLGPDEKSLTLDPKQIEKTNSTTFTMSPGETAVLQKQISFPLSGSDNPPNDSKVLLVFATPKVIGSVTFKFANSSTSPPKTDPIAVKKMNDTKQAAIALISFASDNQNQFPTSIAQASRYLKDVPAEQIENNFDVLIPSGSMNDLTEPSKTVLLREKQAWQSPDGLWRKTYAFADGHVVIASSRTGDFGTFEKDQTISQPK